MEGLSTTRTRVVFNDISPRAYEHPADRAALTALRKVPGFDLMIRKLVGFVGERSVRYMHLSNAVRVSERQFADLNRIYEDCLRTLDMPERPELYVAQNPWINAGAVGVDRPFIVLNSSTLELFDEQELRLIVGHELGHVLSDHALYKTMLRLLSQLAFGSYAVPLGGLALATILSAFREWDRKSELSADRAGLLCVQDPQVAYTVHMKMAGGTRVGEMDVDEFMAQARDYEKAGDVVDGAVKLFNLLGRTHPFHVIRLAELRRWVEDEQGYRRVLSGEYPRRGEDEPRRIYDDVADAARSYRDGYAGSQDPLAQFMKDVTSMGASMLGKARGLFTPRSDD